MGSRTGSTYKKIAGTNTRQLNKIGGSVAKGLKDADNNLQQNTSTQTNSGVSSESQFRTPITIVGGVVANSTPCLDLIYYTSNLFDNVVDSIEHLNFNVSMSEAYSLFMGNSLPTNIAQSLVVDNVSDLAWDNLKQEMDLNTTPNQDRLARFIISQTIGITLDLIKEKIKGKEIDKHFFYKKAIGSAIEYTLGSLLQSSSGSNNIDDDPLITYGLMNISSQEICETTLKEITKEIADNMYEEIKNSSFPKKTKFQNTLRRNISKTLDIQVSKSKFDIERKYIKKEFITVDKKKIPINLKKNQVVLSTQTSFNDESIDRIFKIKLKPNENEYIQKRLNNNHNDLLNLASTLSRIEFLMRNEDPKIIKKIKKNMIPEKITIYSNVHNISEDAKTSINTLSSFLLNYKTQIDFSFFQDQMVNKKDSISKDEEESEAIILFSGGLDSVSSVEYAKLKKKYKNPKFVFVNNSSPKIRTIVDRIANDLNITKDLIVFQTQNGGYFLQQTRGFLFLTAAAVTADIYNAKKIIVAECGVTKYQPSISYSDEITKTTHPFMIELAKMVYKDYGIDVEIEFPFDDNTKTEIIASSSNINLLKSTHSCRYSLFSSYEQKECGYCFACIMKNISLSYIERKKQNQFRLDPITKPINYVGTNLGNKRYLNHKNYESILSIIGFSKSVLADNVKEPTLYYIEQYNKLDLFRRTSEDMIYGLMYMKKKGWIENEVILNQLNKIEKENWFKSERINERRNEILAENEHLK